MTKPKFFHGVLLQSLSFPLRPLFTSQWGPSCWSPSQKPATPPWAGRTVTTRSNRSRRKDREARERRPHRERHGVPSLRHDHFCRKPVDRGHLTEEITQKHFLYQYIGGYFEHVLINMYYIYCPGNQNNTGAVK